MKKILSLWHIILFATLTACSGGGSDSGGPAGSFPAAFVGVYQGTLNVTVSAAGISQSDSAPITITVTPDAQLQFSSSETDETFSVGVTNDGSFNLNIDFVVDGLECTNMALDAAGQINAAGTSISADVTGQATCTVEGITLDVELSGELLASR